VTGWIPADWPVSDSVVAGVTTREGGVSEGGCASLNLAAHVGDAATAVSENRRRLKDALSLSVEPVWLDQVHGAAVHRASADVPPEAPPRADASVTGHKNVALGVLTADCLPVLIADRAGEWIGAAHGGWRGLAAGIIENTVASIPIGRTRLVAWLGPAISQPAFEVGAEVRDAFLASDPALAECFEENPRGRFQADLYAIARRQLEVAGVAEVFGGGFCTFDDEARFYSHRRDPESGRMATVIVRRP